MKTRAFAFSTVLLITTGCTKPAAETPGPFPTQPGTGFFVGVDPARLPAQDRAVLLAAEKDIDLVLHGKPPACKDKADSGESDGGTLHYRCPHYTLTVMRSLHSIGDVHGTLYGPVITFPDDNSISYVRFFSTDALNAILAGETGN